MRIGREPHPVMLIRTLVLLSALSVASTTMIAAGPRLVIEPNPASLGEPVTLHGHEFCGASNCSTITVYVNDEIVVEGVEPREDGTFSTELAAPVGESGLYEVRATQRNLDTGETIESTADFALANEDEPEPFEPEP